MFKVEGTIIDAADIPFELEGKYSGKTEDGAVKQFKAHVHKKHGYKVFIRNIKVTQIKNDNPEGGNEMNKELTVKEMKEILKGKGFKGLSNMKKIDLESMLVGLEAAEKVAEEVKANVEPKVKAEGPVVVSNLDELFAGVFEDTETYNKKKLAEAYKAITESLMRLISHSTKIGTFSADQADYMKKHGLSEYPIGKELVSKDSFVLPGFKSARYEVFFVCNMEGVEKVVKYDKLENTSEISWTPAMGAYVKPVTYTISYPSILVSTIFKEVVFSGLIDRKETKDGNIAGEGYVVLGGKQLPIRYEWAKAKNYKVPAVYSINPTIQNDKGTMSKDDRFISVVKGLIVDFEKKIKAGEIEASAVNEVVKQVVKQVAKQVAITDNAEPGKKARSTKGMASLFED